MANVLDDGDNLRVLPVIARIRSETYRYFASAQHHMGLHYPTPWIREDEYGVLISKPGKLYHKVSTRFHILARKEIRTVRDWLEKGVCHAICRTRLA